MKTAALTVRLLWTCLSTHSADSGAAAAMQVGDVQGADQGNDESTWRGESAYKRRHEVAAASADVTSGRARASTKLHSQESEALWTDDWDDEYIPRSYSHPEPESPAGETNETETDVEPTPGLASTGSHGRQSRLVQSSGLIILGMLTVAGVALLFG
jgi:hypothetical protein